MSLATIWAALFKPDAVEQARREYAHAIAQAGKREAGL
jgi:hypothetical protein